MTKVVTHFTLTHPLDEQLMERISDAHAKLGFQRVQLTHDLKEVVVEWDASRLTQAQVDAVLHRAGIPAVRR